MHRTWLWYLRVARWAEGTEVERQLYMVLPHPPQSFHLSPAGAPCPFVPCVQWMTLLHLNPDTGVCFHISIYVRECFYPVSL